MLPKKFTRRQFLEYSGFAIAASASGCATQGLSNFAFLAAPAAQAPAERISPTLCTMCPSSCGLNVRVIDDRAIKVEGNPLHPLNQGVCCPKGQASLEILYSPERLHAPLVRNRMTGEFKMISWGDALDLVSRKLADLRRRGEAHTVAFLYGETRGQMRSLFHRWLTAYGSPNAIQVNDADAQAARLAMFLSQGVNDTPVIDWTNARYVIAFGGSFAESSRHQLGSISGVGFMRRSTPRRGKLVVIDPRLSVSAAKADEWIPIRPGTLGALALGMAHVLIQGKLYDEQFVRDLTFGFDDFRDERGGMHLGYKNLVLQEYTLPRVEAVTGIPSGTIARLAGEFAASQPAVAMLPTARAALASGNALACALAIHALNALGGNIDRPGGILVQRYPKLAALPSFSSDAIAQTGIQVERIDGAGTSESPLAVSATRTFAEHLASQKPYALNALFISGTNPVFDQGREFAEALSQVPFVVSFAATLDETAAHSDLILPTSTAFESWGDAYVEGTGYAGLAISQPVIPNLADTKSVGDILLALAQRIGGPVAEALPFPNYQTLLKYRVAGSAIDWNKLVENGAWSQLTYFNATPGSQVWNSEVIGRDRVFAPRDGRFDFFSREMFSALKNAGITPQDRDCLPHFDLPVEAARAPEFPFALVLHETLTQLREWHGIAPTLEEVYGLQDGVRWDSWVEINPKAAASLGIENGDWVWVESPREKLKARAKFSQGLWPNAVALPVGPGHATSVAWGRASRADVTVGVNPIDLVARQTEKWSGIPVFASTRVKVFKA